MTDSDANTDRAPACPHCGAAYDREHRFCGRCGGRLPVAAAAAAVADPGIAAPAPSPSDESRQSADRELDRIAGPRYGETPPPRPAPARADAANPAYYISPNRIILLTALSTGLYAFYWMYLTWRQYRDHTGATAYPVCHALTLLAPVYQFFRLHAHIRAYRELMDEWGVPSTLNPLLSLGLAVAAVALLWAAARMVSDAATLEEQPTIIGVALSESQRIGYFAANAARVALMAVLMWQAQGNLNRYWQRRIGMPLAAAPVSLVEIALSILGIINWIGWTVILLNPELLATDGAEGGAQ